MFIEKRKKGKSTKYYLVHSYRLGDKVKRISRYLGSNLTKIKVEQLRKRAEKIISEQIKDKSILEFELSKEEIQNYKKFDFKIKVEHLQKLDWKKFTEIFTYNTNAIEGSTVDLKEVRDLISKKDLPEDKEEVETINVAKAVDYIRNSKDEINISFIKKLHKICFGDTGDFAGKLRDVGVVVRDSLGTVHHVGPPAKDVKPLLDELFKWYEKHKNKYPVLLLTAMMHNQFEYIHPFRDGNGRVGRLLLNYVLLRHKYPPINIRLKDRQKYYDCLKKYSKTRDLKQVLRFLINEYKKQYR